VSCFIKLLHYLAGFISDPSMRLSISVPLHPGAVKFYAQRNRQSAQKQ